MLRFKPGTSLKLLRPAGGVILCALAAAAHILGREVWVSCANEGHGPTDPHTTGEAFDVSLLGLEEAQVADLVANLFVTGSFTRERFTVLYEYASPLDAPKLEALKRYGYQNPHATAKHLHIQRRKGTVYP